MKLVRPTKYSLFILSVLLLLLIASCGRSAQEQSGIAEVAPSPSGTPPVDYGASLSEWEDATQADSEQADSDGNNRNGETTQAISPLALTSPLAMSREAETETEIGTPFTFDDVVYRKIDWDGLIPADFTAEAIMAKYAEQLAEIEDGSPEASELYSKMQEEFSNAPVNELIDDTLIRMPGFIAPLDYTEDLITEFLLVPYFGACIHVPPPPANQTVLVKAAEGEGITVEDSYNPIWVMGKLTVEGTTTELATAGYSVQDAIFEPYAQQ